MDVTAPTASKCDVSATSSMATAPADGADATVTIDTTRDCTWSASTNSSWITLGSTTAGQGSGSIDVHIAANPNPAARSGAIAVNDRSVTISQAAAPCTFSVTPANAAISAGGGTVTVQVSTVGGCAWTSSRGAPWLTVSGGANGPGTATITATANTGPERSGTATIADQTVTITQAAQAAPAPSPAPAPNPAPACSYALSPTSYESGAPGGAVPVSLTTANGCAWDAQSTAEWITVTGAASGSGPATVALSIAANTGGARTGSVTIGGQLFNVSQAAAPPPPPPCRDTIAPDAQPVGALGGSLTVSVTTTAGCAWTAVANAAWISVAQGTSGSGSGTVSLSIQANLGAPRSATVTIAGNTFTVKQAGVLCSYTISPSKATVPANAGAGSVTVTAAPGCAWIATSRASWIAITAGAIGTGNGTVQYSVTANGKKDRNGEIAIANHTFEITQRGTRDDE